MIFNITNLKVPRLKPVFQLEINISVCACGLKILNCYLESENRVINDFCLPDSFNMKISIQFLTKNNLYEFTTQEHEFKGDLLLNPRI